MPWSRRSKLPEPRDAPSAALDAPARNRRADGPGSWWFRPRGQAHPTGRQCRPRCTPAPGRDRARRPRPRRRGRSPRRPAKGPHVSSAEACTAPSSLVLDRQVRGIGLAPPRGTGFGAREPSGAPSCLGRGAERIFVPYPKEPDDSDRGRARNGPAPPRPAHAGPPPVTGSAGRPEGGGFSGPNTRRHERATVRTGVCAARAKSCGGLSPERPNFVP